MKEVDCDNCSLKLVKLILRQCLYGNSVDLRNKTSVSVFYRGNKIWVRVRVRMN